MKLIQKSNLGFRVCFFNNFIEKNQNKTQFEEGSNSHTSLRAGSRYQITWILGKVPNGSWPHPSEWSLSLEIMYMHFILSGPRASLHVVDHYKRHPCLTSESSFSSLLGVATSLLLAILWCLTTPGSRDEVEATRLRGHQRRRRHSGVRYPGFLIEWIFYWIESSQI